MQSKQNNFIDEKKQKIPNYNPRMMKNVQVTNQNLIIPDEEQPKQKDILLDSYVIQQDKPGVMKMNTRSKSGVISFFEKPKEAQVNSEEKSKEEKNTINININNNRINIKNNQINLNCNSFYECKYPSHEKKEQQSGVSKQDSNNSWDD